MSEQQLFFTKGPISTIANDIGQPYLQDSAITLIGGDKITRPGQQNGTLFFGLQDDTNSRIFNYNGQDIEVGNHRAYIFLDADNKRYAVTGPVDWNDIIDKPLHQILSEVSMDNTNTSTHTLDLTYLDTTTTSQIDLPFVRLNGDTMTGTLYTSASSPLFIGTNGVIGMRANLPSSFTGESFKYKNGATLENVSHVGQFILTSSFFGTPVATKRHWGAQMAAYDQEQQTYNHIRISYQGIECKHNDIAYNIFQEGKFIVGNKVTLSYNKDTESLDFIFS